MFCVTLRKYCNFETKRCTSFQRKRLENREGKEKRKKKKYRTNQDHVETSVVPTKRQFISFQPATIRPMIGHRGVPPEIFHLPQQFRRDKSRQRNVRENQRDQEKKNEFSDSSSLVRPQTSLH